MEKNAEKKPTMTVVKNESAEKEPSQKASLSYDELNKICAELYQENQKLIGQMRQMDMTNMFRRLDYLFMVLKHAQVINDPEFIAGCVDEIKDCMTVKEDTPEEKK